MLEAFFQALQDLPPAGFTALLGVVGLLVGSFLNVVIYRTPQIMEEEWAQEAEAYAQRENPNWQPQPAALSLSQPRSRCGSCGHRIRWYENIPLLSWFFLRGKCSACKTTISLRYPLIELATGLLFAYTAWRFGATWATLAWCACTAAWMALFWIDWDTTWLPDSINMPLLWLGLIAAILHINPLIAQFNDAFWGAVVGYSILIPLAWAVSKIKGQAAMGNGDYKLLASLGAWLGWQALLPVLLLSSVTGAAIGIGLALNKRLRSYNNATGSEGNYMPYGPFLVLAGLIVYVIGTQDLLALIGLNF